MAAALASWAGGQNPAYKPPPAELRPETMSRVGTDSERAARVHRANGVPRPAKAGAADLPERQRITREATRAGMTHDGCPGLQALPRRLRRPRHGLRTTHRRPTLAFRLRPETGRGLARRLRRPRHGFRTIHRRPTLAFRFRPEVSGRSIEHALAARAEDHLCVALDLVEELGWDAHAAALADTAAHLDHCEAAAAREDHLVLALAHADRRQLRAHRARGGRLGAHGVLRRGHPPLTLGHRAGLGAQAVIHQRQRRQDLDLRRHLPPWRRTRHPDRRWWAQCDSNTRPTGYEPAALTA